MSDAKQEKPKRRFHLQLPHVYTIAFMLIVFFAVLTWIVPSGQFDRQTIQTAAGEREVAVAGTYQEVDKVYTDSETGETVDLRQGIDAVLQAPAKGIQAAADVVAFVLLIGGSFAIVTKTNALNAGMSRVIKKLKNKDILIIPISMILLSICGTTFGMSEEALPFYAIFIPIMLSIGYDSMTAFIICFLGPNLGYCASTIDPFNVLIAQGVIGIEGNPQLWLRAILWVIFTAAGIFWAMRYARRVKLDPKSSITYEDDKQKRIEFSVTDASIEEEFTLRHKLVEFYIEPDGTITLVGASESPHPALTEHVQKLILDTSGQWTPLLEMGHPCRYLISFPVNFDPGESTSYATGIPL